MTAAEIEMTKTMPHSRVIRLDSGTSPLTGRAYALQHVLAGWEIAGSGIRAQTEGYRVATTIDGASHSQFFRSEQDARSRFVEITTKGDS